MSGVLPLVLCLFTIRMSAVLAPNLGVLSSSDLDFT